MLSVEEIEDKLLIKENPSKIWIFMISLFLVVWSCGYFGFSGIVIGISIVLSVGFYLGFLLIVTNNEIILDKKKRELSINKKGFFSFNNERQIYKFDDLAETVEFEQRRVGKVKNYFAYVKKTSGKKVDLFDSSELGEEKFFILFKLSNQYFMGLSNSDFRLSII